MLCGSTSTLPSALSQPRLNAPRAGSSRAQTSDSLVLHDPRRLLPEGVADV